MTPRPTAEQVLRWLCVLLPWAALGYGLRFSPFGLPTTALEAYAALSVAVFLAARGREGVRQAWEMLPSRVLLVAWLGIGLAAALWAPSVWKGIGLWRAYFLEPIALLAIVNAVLVERRDRDALRRSFWSVATFVSAWAVFEFVTGLGIPHPWNVPILEGRRATGPYGFPNAVALFVAPIAAYAGARWWVFRERWAGVAAAFGLVGALVVRSDGGTLAILGAWALVMAASRVGRALLAIGAVGSAIVAKAAPALADAVWKGVTFQGWSGKVRLFMWRETWAMLKAHWLLGAGLGGYPVVFDAYHKTRFIEIFQYPHQFVLTAWSETGLPGLGMFLGLLVSWGRRAWTASGRMAERFVGLAPLVAVVVHGLVDVPYWKNDLAVAFFLLWWLAAWVDRPARMG